MLENHGRTDGHTAAVGLGMGGSLAFEAALHRNDLEAAVSFYGFPQRYLGKFKDAKTPILAVYGSADPFVASNVIDELRRELAQSPLGHEVVILDGAARDFLSENLIPDAAKQPGSIAWQTMLAFLEKHQLAPQRRDDAPDRVKSGSWGASLTPKRSSCKIASPTSAAAVAAARIACCCSNTRTPTRSDRPRSDEHLLMPPDERERLGIEVFRADRGGDITYHGPGQLVGYPIIQLERDTLRTDFVGYVRKLEQVIIATLADYGVRAKPIKGLTGVWVDTTGARSEPRSPRLACASTCAP